MTSSFSQPQAKCQEPKISLPWAEMISSPRSWSSQSRALKNSLVSSLISLSFITPLPQLDTNFSTSAAPKMLSPCWPYPKSMLWNTARALGSCWSTGRGTHSERLLPCCKPQRAESHPRAPEMTHSDHSNTSTSAFVPRETGINPTNVQNQNYGNHSFHSAAHANSQGNSSALARKSEKSKTHKDIFHKLWTICKLFQIWDLSKALSKIFMAQ